MSAHTNRIQVLLNEYTNNSINEDGFRELCELLKEDNDTFFKELFEKELREAVFTEMDKAKLARMLEVIRPGTPGIVKEKSTGRLLHNKPVVTLWQRWAVAASVVLLLSVAGYFLFFNNRGKPVKTVTITQATPVDVNPPATNRAVILLANGNKVYLDQVNNGSLAKENGAEVVKLADGQIQYSRQSVPQNGVGNREIIYNTLSNPRGSRVIAMTLADGSKVWLNAGSTITYPVLFTGTERKVQVTGEAYFEVAPAFAKATAGEGGQKTPFIVSINSISGEHKADVEVLGTHFNINAYDDEEIVRTTLLEGKVKITELKTHNSKILQPGEQAQLTTNYPEGTPRSKLQTTNNVDVEQVMAWKNGRFEFNDASIETIMKEISRWYDTEIIYTGKIPGNFVADISRDVPVSKLLQILELTNRVHFTIEGKKVMVKP